MTLHALLFFPQESLPQQLMSAVNTPSRPIVRMFLERYG
ncbi:hypothetical protein MPS_5344 [Mycobacterium pseudoshottsii JCM 15466]|nr:hypothetical protein MPS_5344 [Mycobacterium pseudoshottsii JCM 15466]